MPETVTMLTLVGNGITSVIGWVASFINELIGAEGQLAELAPLFAIGISISAILLAIRLIKSTVWGA